jgi:hypothetical protein
LPRGQEPGTLAAVSIERFTGVKVFSTTLARDREALSERINGWLRDNAHVEVIDKVVRQSSDQEFHCLTIIFFFREKGA